MAKQRAQSRYFKLVTINLFLRLRTDLSNPDSKIVGVKCSWESLHMAVVLFIRDISI